MTSLILTPTIARRLAVTRQWLAGPLPATNEAGMITMLRDLGCVQIDPIRAVERTQYLVLWSRLGRYDPAQFEALLWEERRLFEYWAHAASIVLTEDYPLHHLRMRNYGQGTDLWSRRIQTWLAENETFRHYILDRLRHEGPLSIKDLEDRSVTPWQSTGWTHERNVDRMLEFLWGMGHIFPVERRGLQKKWGLAEHHLPAWTPREVLPEAEIVRRAAQQSLRSLGVATARQINNHFIRGYYPNLKQILAELVAQQLILPVTLAEGDTVWPGEWYLHRDDLPLLESLNDGAWQPRTTLLSPFDNLICDRERTELLWDFRFRIEIYVPKAKRQYGYYVLPILHGERLIGRIDPRMDRKSGILHVNNLYAEPDAPQGQAVGQAIITAIEDLARFLGARDIQYGGSLPAAWM